MSDDMNPPSLSDIFIGNWKPESTIFKSYMEGVRNATSHESKNRLIVNMLVSADRHIESLNSVANDLRWHVNDKSQRIIRLKSGKKTREMLAEINAKLDKILERSGQ